MRHTNVILQPNWPISRLEATSPTCPEVKSSTFMLLYTYETLNLPLLSDKTITCDKVTQLHTIIYFHRGIKWRSDKGGEEFDCLLTTYIP